MDSPSLKLLRDQWLEIDRDELGIAKFRFKILAALEGLEPLRI